MHGSPGPRCLPSTETFQGSLAIQQLRRRWPHFDAASLTSASVRQFARPPFTLSDDCRQGFSGPDITCQLLQSTCQRMSTTPGSRTLPTVGTSLCPSRVCQLPSVGTGAAHHARKRNARSATSLQAPKVARDPCEPLTTGRTSKGRVARERKLGSSPEALLTPPGHLTSPISVAAGSDIAAAICYWPRTAHRRCPAKGLARANSPRCLPSPETSWPEP